MPEAQWKAFANTPHRDDRLPQTSPIKYGWKVGQKIPIGSNIYPQKNGSKAWAVRPGRHLRWH